MSTNCEFRFSTLNERTLHRAVKDYLEPDRRCQEVAVAGMVADIFREGQLWEVQTGSVTPLVKKLLRLPEEYPVTIVLPIVREKTICTLSAEGELLSRRRSPKKGSWWESYYQLPRLLPLGGPAGDPAAAAAGGCRGVPRRDPPPVGWGVPPAAGWTGSPLPLGRSWIWPFQGSCGSCFHRDCPTPLPGRNCKSTPACRPGA